MYSWLTFQIEGTTLRVDVCSGVEWWAKSGAMITGIEELDDFSAKDANPSDLPFEVRRCRQTSRAENNVVASDPQSVVCFLLCQLCQILAQEVQQTLHRQVGHSNLSA
jgi:hypothetical protein